MRKQTNEKGLIVVQDNFLSRVKNFFSKAIYNIKSRYDGEYYYEEYDDEYEDDDVQDFSQEESVEKERKLFDFDAEDNGDWPVNEFNSGNVQEVNSNVEQDYETVVDEKDEEIDYEKEEYSQAYLEKQELEQKLINYYNSIKKEIE